MASNARRKPSDGGPPMSKNIATTEGELIGAVASIDARLEAVESMMNDHRGDTKDAFVEINKTLSEIRGEVKGALDAALKIANAAAVEAKKANDEVASLKRLARWLWGIIVTLTIGAAWLFDHATNLRGPHQ